MVLYLRKKDCIRHTIRSIAPGKAAGSEGVVQDTTAHGKSPKSAVQQVLVYISRCLDTTVCHVPA